jgi:ParB family chromosome partitioning protein
MNVDQEHDVTPEVFEEKREEKIAELPLGVINTDPDQPRKDFDEEKLRELSNSIDKIGMQSPILVRPIGNGTYELIYGERRYKAHQLLKKDTIKCIIRNVSDREKIAIQLTENIIRQDLSPIEEARAFERLNVKLGLTHEQIGETIGKSRSYISNKLRLLQLPPDIQDAISEGKIFEGHARLLLQVKENPKREKITQKIIDKKLSIKKASQLVESLQNVSRETLSENKDVIDPLTLKIRDLLFREEFQQRIPKQLLISVLIKDLKLLRGQ